VSNVVLEAGLIQRYIVSQPESRLTIRYRNGHSVLRNVGAHRNSHYHPLFDFLVVYAGDAQACKGPLSAHPQQSKVRRVLMASQRFNACKDAVGR
jgi:hypothetical protein